MIMKRWKPNISWVKTRCANHPKESIQVLLGQVEIGDDRDVMKKLPNETGRETENGSLNLKRILAKFSFYVRTLCNFGVPLFPQLLYNYNTSSLQKT